eukprot:CAMPEP_0168772970 /NCGR_PEP_ID=MMETSP0725-20121227/4231_1 /TAXON_ID=265536 /ORGANISM="Amphiprora sp., Strain CCMP467" /LENGTH=350 /DNA_ID=CAMNT_0008822505 /DNA_START=23 /DNA_END=1072 /DNA_ORIENTATION=+
MTSQATTMREHPPSSSGLGDVPLSSTNDDAVDVTVSSDACKDDDNDNNNGRSRKRKAVHSTTTKTTNKRARVVSCKGLDEFSSSTQQDQQQDQQQEQQQVQQSCLSADSTSVSSDPLDSATLSIHSGSSLYREHGVAPIATTTAPTTKMAATPSVVVVDQPAEIPNLTARRERHSQHLVSFREEEVERAQLLATQLLQHSTNGHVESISGSSSTSTTTTTTSNDDSASEESDSVTDVSGVAELQRDNTMTPSDDRSSSVAMPPLLQHKTVDSGTSPSTPSFPTEATKATTRTGTSSILQALRSVVRLGMWVLLAAVCARSAVLDTSRLLTLPFWNTPAAGDGAVRQVCLL